MRSVVEWRPWVDLDAEMEKLAGSGVSVFTWRDDGYPARLREIHDYPSILYVKGTILPEDEWCLGVVGTRRASAYGRQVTEEIVADLARHGIVIVSGLPVATVSSTLAMMEIKGMVKSVGNDEIRPRPRGEAGVPGGSEVTEAVPT